jgi:hypothetical protein
VNCLFACVRREMPDCVEPALRTLLLVMSYAQAEVGLLYKLNSDEHQNSSYGSDAAPPESP